MKIVWMFILFLLTGCTTSQITGSWTNKNVPVKNFSPIMIVGIMADEDSALCRKMEQRFALSLKELGYNAFSAVAVYGPDVYENIQEEDIFKLIYARNIAAVITIELLEKQKEKYSAPQWQDNDYYRNLRWYESRDGHPFEHYLYETNYIWESNYYDMDGFLMLYSVRSKTYEPGSQKSLAVEYSKMIINDMEKKGLLKKQVIVLKPF